MYTQTRDDAFRDMAFELNLTNGDKTMFAVRYADSISLPLHIYKLKLDSAGVDESTKEEFTLIGASSL